MLKESPEKVGEGDDLDEEGEEVEVVAAPSKGKSVFSIPLPRALKRKTADRSPEASISVSVKKGGARETLVGVLVPEPPIPHQFYLQLGASSSFASAPPVPLSSSPSLTSLASRFTSSSQNFEIERLQIQLNSANDEIAFLREKLFRQALQFERERALFHQRIKELEGAPMEKRFEGSWN